MYDLREKLTEIPHKILLLLRFIVAEWKAVLGYTILAVFAFSAICALAVSCADLSSVQCHTYHVKSTVPTTGEPAIEDKTICTTWRDR